MVIKLFYTLGFDALYINYNSTKFDNNIYVLRNICFIVKDENIIFVIIKECRNASNECLGICYACCTSYSYYIYIFTLYRCIPSHNIVFI